MKLNELAPTAGSTKSRKRVGRGTGSGLGKTSGRGHKGLGQRAGASVRPGFEGGQMPLARRLPKRGFVNIYAERLDAVNVSALEAFDNDAVVGVEELVAAGLVKKCKYGVKVLGNGELTKKLTVRANAFSASARSKIEAAGGTAEVL